MLINITRASQSTAVGQVVACAPVTQRARVRSPDGTSFLGEVFSGFFLTCKTLMSESFRPPRPPISFCHHYHHHTSFITGANDLRCWRALKLQIYKQEHHTGSKWQKVVQNVHPIVHIAYIGVAESSQVMNFQWNSRYWFPIEKLCLYRPDQNIKHCRCSDMKYLVWMCKNPNVLEKGVIQMEE